MELISKLLVAVVALEHVYIFYLEMFLWTTPRALRIFGNTPASAEASKVLAANQGLYNGFLALGLGWGLLHPNTAFGVQIQVFFILCVVLAALYGGLTAKRSILLVQGLPALLALLSLIVWRS